MRWRLGDEIGLDAWLTANGLAAVRTVMAFNLTTHVIPYLDNSRPGRRVDITYGVVGNDRRVIAVDVQDIPAGEIVDVESAAIPPSVSG